MVTVCSTDRTGFCRSLGLGKGLAGCLFFPSEITYLLELAGQLSISEYIKNWEEVAKSFLCAVLNGELSFERF